MENAKTRRLAAENRETKNFVGNVQAANRYLRKIDALMRWSLARPGGQDCRPRKPERPEGVFAGDQPRAGTRPADGEAKNRQTLTLSTLERKPTPCPRPCNHPPAAPGRKPRPPPPPRPSRQQRPPQRRRPQRPPQRRRPRCPSGRPAELDPSDVLQPHRNYLPKTLAKFFAIRAIEIESHIRLRRLGATGAGEVSTARWLAFVQKNGIQLTPAGLELARSRRAVAMGLPAPPTTAQSAR